MALLLPLLLPSLTICEGVSASLLARDPSSSFDSGWLFLRGHSPDDVDLRPSISTPRHPGCTKSSVECFSLALIHFDRCPRFTYPLVGAGAYDVDINDTPCISDWFAQLSANGTATACAAACCTRGGSCDAWQFCPARGAPCSSSQPGCWLGRGLWQWHCEYNNGSGWVGSGRHPTGTRVPTSPATPSDCRTTFCQPEFNDSSWRVLPSLPHDFSSEDLPPREDDDAVAPVLAPRVAVQSPWLFRAGDDLRWANASSVGSWTVAKVPLDWRQPPLSYNGTLGWYRRKLRSVDVPGALLRANWSFGSGPRLGLGVVCGSDQTFLNGVLLGSTAWPTGSSSKSLLKRYAIPRVYLIPQGLLRGDGTDIVAVRIDASGPAQSLALPRGLADITYYGPDGQQVAIRDIRNGPFSSESNSVQRPDSDTADFVDQGWTLGDNPRSNGYTTAGQGWYRKTFVLDPSLRLGSSSEPSERVSLLFDGVYGICDAWLNGHYLGRHIYGYTAFSLELTAHLSPAGGKNVLAVRVSNLGATSRWYSGSGIYRSVKLMRTPLVHIPQWGIAVTSSNIRMAAPSDSTSRSQTAACIVNIAIDLVNSGAMEWNGNISVVLSGGLGTASAQVVGLAAGGNTTVSVAIPVDEIVLWSTESPALHTATVTTSVGEQHVVEFGVKVLNFSAAGLMLNGAELKLRGGCCHHDNGPLGTVAIGRAEERRLELLKAIGYNAVRTAHNPPSSKFLAAADRIGIIIIDEAFDCWHQGKNPDDYNLYFDRHWKEDIAAMVRRDMNHVSVFFFSIGNEIPQGLSAKGVREAADISAFIRMIDPQRRPLTMGFNKGSSKAELAVLGDLDVPGNNYDCTGYEAFHQQFPNKTMITTESGPAQSFEFTIGGVANHSWVGGDFIWTAIDHIGESAIGFAAATGSLEAAWGTLPFPHHINFAGDLDIVGGIKPQSLYRQVLWDVLPLALSVHRPGSAAYWQAWGWDDEIPSWSWPPSVIGTLVHVRVYSKCANVEVSLNNRTAAIVQPSVANKYNASLIVRFQPGTLSAVCVSASGNRRDLSSFTRLVSSGEPHSLDLVSDRTTIGSSTDDLAFIKASVTDSAGVLCDNQRHSVAVNFTVTGGGYLYRVGSGDPVDTDSFTSSKRDTWRGHAIAVVRPLVDMGTITLVASAPGLERATLTINVRKGA